MELKTYICQYVMILHVNMFDFLIKNLNFQIEYKSQLYTATQLQETWNMRHRLVESERTEKDM